MDKIVPIPGSSSDKLLETWGYNLTGEYLEILSAINFNKNTPVFEIATGSGRAVSVLTRLGYKIITGDADSGKRQDAEARITAPFLDNVTFMIMNIEKLSFADDSVNSTVCFNTLHELENPHKGLAELIRVMNPAGKLLVADFSPLGYDVMDRLHKTKFNELHPRGKITTEEIKSTLSARFNKVSVIKAELNIAYLAEDKIKG